MTSTPFTNPYVGPRSFETKDNKIFFGRSREIMDLLDLLIAERVVMLYSPSGAGKSSLIKAGLIPQLIKEAFTVLPVIRVSQGAPQEFTIPPDTNRYIFSVLLSLEEALPPEQQIPLDICAKLNLPTYLQQRRDRLNEPGSTVLIFDQFEEILTIEPTNQGAKVDFFDQVGQALRHPDTWVIFSLREDYIAGLDPYLRAIPTRLSTTFRLELLGKEAAQESMQGPAKKEGVDFTNAAATKLIRDLSQIRVQQQDGQIKEQEGLYIEPVQLQVVCNRLWTKKFPSSDAPPPEGTTIEPADVKEAGDVDTALADYYADQVKVTAAKTGVSERVIRNWCDTELITPQNIRGQVLRGKEKSQGLDNRVIKTLVDAHLLRAEDRRGVIWYELAHDRLIKPIRDDNAAWQQEHLTTFQREAALWNDRSRYEGLLLRDEALKEAVRWAETHPNQLELFEREFLEKSQNEQAQRHFMRWMFRLMVVVTIVAIAAMIVAAINATKANTAQAEAEEQKSIAIAAQAESEQQKYIAIAAQETAAAALDSASIANAALDQAMAQQAIAVAANSTALAAANSAATANAALEQLPVEQTTPDIVAQAAAEAAQGTAMASQQIAAAQQQTANEALEVAVVANEQAEAQRSKANEAIATSQAAIPATSTPTISPTPSPTATPTARPSNTPTPTPTPSNTPTSTPNRTATAAIVAQTRQAAQTATAIAQAAIATATARPPFPPPGQIIFTSNRFINPGELFVMNADGSQVKPLGLEFSSEPSYSAASDSIVFSRPSLADGEKVSLRAVSLSGEGLRIIEDRSEDNWEPAISPDSQQLAFTSTRDNADKEIYIMPMDRSSPALRVCEREIDPELVKWAPAWSPDGQQIAFVVSEKVSGEDQYESHGGIWIADATGQNCQKLTDTPDSLAKFPDWSPDGEEIVYVSNRNDKPFRLYRMNSDGSNQQEIANSPNHVNYPAWSPDGQWLTFSVSTRRQDSRPDAIFVMTINGDHLTSISDISGEDWYSIWLPGTTSAPLVCSFDTPSEFDTPRRAYQKLACPLPPVPVGGPLSWQPFENGSVFWSGLLEQYIVAFNDDTWWLIRQNEIPAPLCHVEEPPDGFIRPDGGIGDLWCGIPGLAQQLGFAQTRKDSGNGFLRLKEGYIWRNESGGNNPPTFFVFFGQNQGDYVQE